ncbi:MAG: CinA family protein [Burkholderiaceae bacterium]
MTESAFSIDEDQVVSLAAQLGRALEAAGGLVATAESCTGGLIARALTEIAGSSAWFDRGVVTYSNEAKQALLGVQAESLERHGAVSEVVACEMAAGALRMLPVDRLRMALSVTGIAGPGGAVPGKPVGTVCFGWALHPGPMSTTAGPADDVSAAIVTTRTVLFQGDRAAVRRQAAAFALDHAMSLLAHNLVDRPPSA